MEIDLSVVSQSIYVKVILSFVMFNHCLCLMLQLLLSLSRYPLVPLVSILSASVTRRLSFQFVNQNCLPVVAVSNLTMRTGCTQKYSALPPMLFLVLSRQVVSLELVNHSLINLSPWFINQKSCLLPFRNQIWRKQHAWKYWDKLSIHSLFPPQVAGVNAVNHKPTMSVPYTALVILTSQKCSPSALKGCAPLAAAVPQL